MAELTTVTVQILGKPYQVSCPEEEVEALSASARYLDNKMASIKSSGKIVGLDRIAVMAALNIANEFLTSEHTYQESTDTVDTRMARMVNRLDVALAKHRQPDA
jgi:cell division protein ZapA